MSSINSRFERTNKALSLVIDENQFPPPFTELDFAMSDLDSHLKQDFKPYSVPLKALYQLEKSIEDKCSSANFAKLLKNHIHNIARVEHSVVNAPFEPLKWLYEVNPNTFILKAMVDGDRLLSAIENKEQVTFEIDHHFFVRPALFKKRQFLEVPLQDWNLLLIDLFDSDSSFTGSDIFEIISENVDAIGGRELLRQKVVDFLRVQLVYMNSLVIV